VDGHRSVSALLNQHKVRHKDAVFAFAMTVRFEIYGRRLGVRPKLHRGRTIVLLRTERNSFRQNGGYGRRDVCRWILRVPPLGARWAFNRVTAERWILCNRIFLWRIR
jgi:hypothetical protein